MTHFRHSATFLRKLFEVFARAPRIINTMRTKYEACGYCSDLMLRGKKVRQYIKIGYSFVLY